MWSQGAVAKSKWVRVHKMPGTRRLMALHCMDCLNSFLDGLNQAHLLPEDGSPEKSAEAQCQ